MAAAEAAAHQSDVEKGRMIAAAAKGSITRHGASTVAKAAVNAATEIAEQQEKKLRTAIERELVTAADTLERVESGVMRASRSLRDIDAAISSAQVNGMLLLGNVRQQILFSFLFSLFLCLCMHVWI